MPVHLRNFLRHRSVPSRQLRSWASVALSSLNLDRAELGLLLVGDRRIRTLNREYRGRDGRTNVLSFPMDALSPGGRRPHLLGDVVISLDSAQREARQRGLSLRCYLQVLLVHGILHLTGLDHERSAREARRMARAERRLLRIMGEARNGLI